MARGGRAGGGASPPAAPSTCAWWRRGCPTSPCPPGTPSRPGWSSWSAGAPPTGTGRGGPSGCRGPTPNSTASWPIIGALGFPGYFLTVWDIVLFCRRQDIFCQGRGSAATSAVCYALGITNVDAVSLGLLFERFLSPARDGPPDIDVDIESGRREEVIQYVYERYGRLHAAQVANVITYRSRSALRDMGKALGHPAEEVDAWAKSVDRGEPLGGAGRPAAAGEGAGHRPARLPPTPRHPLGGHGHLRPAGGRGLPGRVGTDARPERAPVGQGRLRRGRAGQVRPPRPGHARPRCTTWSTWCATFHHVEIDLARLDQEPEVYDLLCRADTVGVFQVESRAQMNTLPRVQPRCFYDLAIEVALIRPGPIQGHAVHPYIRRRNGSEPVTYLHPLLQPALERTLGVPLFQEQLMQIAIDVAGFTPTEADELRQAMSAKRSGERMARLRDRLFAGMAARQVSVEVAEQVYAALAAFANFGFPESHSVAFAHLVYSTAWCKVHYPAAFTAGLLNAQPMGFWSPQSLVADAKRHGVEVRRPDVNAGGADAGLEEAGPDRARRRGPAVRLGLSSVRGIGDGDGGADRRGAARGRAWRTWCAGPASPGPSWRRWPPPAPSTAWGRGPSGAGERAGGSLVWGAGAASQATADRLPGVVTGSEPPPLPRPTPWEEVADDLWSLGMTPDTTAMELARDGLSRRGVLPTAELASRPTGDRITVGGVVTHRQQPESAHGAVFLNLEDETGMVNVVCSRGAWVRWKPVARSCPALLVRGRIERSEGSMTLVAERFEPARPRTGPRRPRDFR